MIEWVKNVIIGSIVFAVIIIPILIVGFIILVVVTVITPSLENKMNTQLASSDISTALIAKYSNIVATDKNGTYINWYFPHPKDFDAPYENGWHDPRPNGRLHKGIDIMCQKEVPIVAVETGVVEKMGWNELGGYSMGIRSVSGYYWYYGHMNSLHPYVEELKVGSEVEGGDVIGFVGATGYGPQVTKDKFAPHLHIGLIVGNDWHNPYPILKAIEQNKVKVKLNDKSEYETVKKDKLYINRNYANYDDLGVLALKYESSGNVGAISNTSGDLGGKSYGIYQIATKTGTMNNFLYGWLETKDKEFYNILTIAQKKDGGFGSNFDAAWKKLATEKTDRFYKIQYNFIYDTHYLPVVNRVKSLTYKNSIDVTKKSKTLQCVVFSTAIQHGEGGATNIITSVDTKADEAIIIDQIYERRKKAFVGQQQNIIDAVTDRFNREKQDALNMLKTERGR